MGKTSVTCWNAFTASATVGQVAQQASQQQIDALEGPCAFLDAFYQYLHDNIREPLNLERVALAFAMSPATLKRKLAKHGTHFQEQLDLVRTHVPRLRTTWEGLIEAGDPDIADVARDSTERFKALEPRLVSLPGQ